VVVVTNARSEKSTGIESILGPYHRRLDGRRPRNHLGLEIPHHRNFGRVWSHSESQAQEKQIGRFIACFGDISSASTPPLHHSLAQSIQISGTRIRLSLSV
jgi:hypothetical protein